MDLNERHLMQLAAVLETGSVSEGAALLGLSQPAVSRSLSTLEARVGAPLFVNDVDVGTGTRPPVMCNLQVAPLAGAPGHMLLLIAPRELTGRVGQNSTVKAAAR